ncbi:hypothetical protein [Marinicella rhabdoformis]|uniref:hypothetical protein n=1 Tax=Marinicella rhabdoformis TaxID=2580566 RepID=UPI0012AECB69|nr:hypothetical protein [Marinicella rhabdoformis]
MEQKFKVIYLGKLSDDANEGLIAERFAEKFKMPEAKATKILRAGKEVVLHPGAEHVKAYKLKAALEGLGLQMRLERVQITQTAKPPELETSKTESPQPQTPESATETPKSTAPQEDKSNTPPAPKQSIDTSAMSLEPMPEESEDESSAEDSNDLSHNQTAEKSTRNESDKDTKLQVGSDVNSPNWDLEPIKEETSDSEDQEIQEGEKRNKQATAKQEFVDLSKPSMIYEKKTEEKNEALTQEQEKATETEEKEPARIIGLIKQFGGVAVAGLVGILFLLKKFGFLKFLKIGGLMAAAAYAGYNPEEACMGNGDCEDAISDQIDACWSYSELDQYDWDNMSDDQYYELKPQVEEKFISCFRYEETGAQVLESPIELRFDLMAMCDELSTPVSGCIAIAERQIKTCYDRSEIIEPIKASGYDYYGTMLTDMQYYKNFYGCFEDNSGSMLFAEFVDNMDVEAINDAMQQLQNELDAQ